MMSSRPSHRSILVLAVLLFVSLYGSYLLWDESHQFGDLLVGPLEQRFRRADMTAPGKLTGIIVLTGGAKRLSEAGRLASHYPHLKVVISGAKGMPGVLAELGEAIEPSRVILETRSRNTHENALYSTELIRPKPGEHWLLVTGASHMPRAIGSFRRFGFEVEPWPVYDLTSRDLSLLDVAMREWLALIAYRLLGRTSTLFPAPAN
jgi:uncharacterized SAM-binding protein YcdF (DUF218 family)